MGNSLPKISVKQIMEETQIKDKLIEKRDALIPKLGNFIQKPEDKNKSKEMEQFFLKYGAMQIN